MAYGNQSYGQPQGISQGRKVAYAPLPPDEPLTLDDFKDIALLGWESDFGLPGGLSAGDEVTSWIDRCQGETMTPAGAGNGPRYIPSDYVRSGYPALDFHYQHAAPSDIRIVLPTAISEPVKVILVGTWMEGGWDGRDRQRRIASVGYDTAPAGPVSYHSLIDTIQDLGTGGPYLQMNYAGFASVHQLPQATIRGDYIEIDVASGDSGLTYGGVYDQTTTSSINDVREIWIGTTNTSVRTPMYIYACYVLDGNADAGRVQEFRDFIEAKWQRDLGGGSFPTFGASEYFELRAEDLSTADGVAVAENWIDRHNSWVFTLNGSNTVMRRGFGHSGQDALQFFQNSQGFFANTADLEDWEQPSTLMWVGKLRWDQDSNTPLIDGVEADPSPNRWKLSGRKIMAGSGVIPTGTNHPRQAMYFDGWRCVFGSPNGASSLFCLDGRDPFTSTVSSVDNEQGCGVGDWDTAGGFYPPKWAIGVMGWRGIQLTQAQMLQVTHYVGLI